MVKPSTSWQISGCIKIDKKLKNYIVTTDDSPSGIKLKKFTDSYRTAVEKWRSKVSDETRRTILGSLGVKKRNNGPLGSSNLIIPQDILVCENPSNSLTSM